ncbi:hypothetical protein [Microlunatus sp. GCM10028923]|uniref:hypothetical protein n=1 Tax=Microlunatus sp. GCM10028923 TaxID=3273400 RepID=UPI00360A5BC5
MTSSTYAPTAPQTGSAAVRRLTIAGGIALLVIAALHLFAMSAHDLWPGWLAGELRSAVPGDYGLGAFWAGIGGFAVPIGFLGFMIIRSGRQGRRCAPWIGYGLLGWAAVCCFLLGPSGFLTFGVPALLLIMAELLGRSRHHGFRG